jgi:hypothetical protein
MTVSKVSAAGSALGRSARAAASAATLVSRREPAAGDSLRSSSLARVLTDTADALLAPPAARDDGVAPVVETTTLADAMAQRESALVREQALMAFARALMQALRRHREHDDAAAEPACHRVWDPVARPVSQLATRPDGDDLSRQHELLGALLDLEHAWGTPAQALEAGGPAHERLYAFLNELADRMGGSATDWADATQPGCLISVRA